MTITINGKDIELNFGIEFVHRLDEFGTKQYDKETADALGYGCGLCYCVPHIIGGDYYALAVLLYTGTWYVKKNRPTVMDIENYLDTIEDLDEFCNEVLEELKKWGASKGRTTERETMMREEMAKYDQETQTTNTNE